MNSFITFFLLDNQLSELYFRVVPSPRRHIVSLPNPRRLVVRRGFFCDPVQLSLLRIQITAFISLFGIDFQAVDE